MPFTIRGLLLLSFFAECSTCYIIPDFSDSFTDTSDYSNWFTDTSNSVVINSLIDTSNAVAANLPTDADQPHSSEFAATSISINAAQTPNLNTGVTDLASSANRLALTNPVMDENLFLNPSGVELSAPTSPSYQIAEGDGGIDLLKMGGRGLEILGASLLYIGAQLANFPPSRSPDREGRTVTGANSYDSKRKRLCPDPPYGLVYTVPTCDEGIVLYLEELEGYILDGWTI
ncbi:hypothetical protein MMC22_003080, partial [Lobaria immixta]|nr:hypothetical protein [Lobaria immixta]